MTTHHRLTLARDGDETTVPAGERETVLEAAEVAGVPLPFGCRTGACASCVGQLVDGAITYERPPRGLRPRYRDAGFVLCCIARPRADCRIAVGADVRGQTIPAPWR